MTDAQIFFFLNYMVSVNHVPQEFITVTKSDGSLHQSSYDNSSNHGVMAMSHNGDDQNFYAKALLSSSPTSLTRVSCGGLVSARACNLQYECCCSKA